MGKHRRVIVKQFTHSWPEGSAEPVTIDTNVIEFTPLDQEILDECGFQRIRYLTLDEFKQEFPDD